MASGANNNIKGTAARFAIAVGNRGRRRGVIMGILAAWLAALLAALAYALFATDLPL